MRPLLLLAAFCAAVFSNAQTTIYTQNFEIENTGYSASTTFGTPGSDIDIFNRSNPNIGGNSTFLWAVEDAPGSSNISETITLDNIDVTGYASFVFSLDLLAHHFNDWDTEDEVLITYTLDGGNSQNLLWIQSTDNSFNEPAAIDTDFDGVGECALSNVLPALSTGTADTCSANSNMFANFSSQLINLNLNSTLSIVLTFNGFASGDEGIYLDNIEVVANTGAVNPAPSITNITGTPSMPTSSDVVTISADITDTDGIASAVLNWGTTSGNLSNNVTMSSTTGDAYTGDIPLQADGTEVFYRIVATDSNSTPETATSAEQTYTVLDPQPQGLQIDVVDTKYLIDFDNTVTNVNNGTFDGSGFALVPSTGQLDADAFAISGLEDATTTFGDEQSGNDFGKGVSDGGVSAGGIYAFEVAANDYALGFQPTSSDFTPGTIELVFTNNTGVTITDLAIAYDAYFYNNASRSNDFTFSHGVDSSSLISISASSVSSRLIDDSSPLWERNLVALNLTGLSIPANGTYVIAWSSSDQGSGSSDEIALDNIQILANPTNASVEASGTVESITLLGDLDLNGQTDVIGNLNLLSGTLTTNDNLTLKSSDGKTAVVGPVVSGVVSGDVTVEQFFPAQRAFRFLGSTVTTTTSIYDNWQQGGANPGDAGYISGNGTHITGGSIQDGFDQSGTNASSLFIFLNVDLGVGVLPQQWFAVSSANGTSTNLPPLKAGDPYRLFIRGDRSISLTTAGPQAPTATTLTTTGELHIGEFDVDSSIGLSPVEGDFNFIANPYQAQVNFTTLFNDIETNDISGAYYAWDPTIGDRGAYVTYTISTGTNNVAGSEVNEFIQPGQAFFTLTTEDGNAAGLAPVVKFKESFKSTNPNTTAVYRNTNELITMSVFRDDEIASGKARDGVIISFNAAGSNQINSKDMTKLANPDENLSVETAGVSLSVTERAVPIHEEVIALKLSGWTGSDYTFQVNNALSSLQTIFVDHYLGTETILSAGVNNLSVSFDTNIPASLDENRFALKFENNVLTLDDSAFAKAVQVYPNPFNGSELTIDGLIIGEVVQINVYNMLGQQVVAFENVASTGKETLINLNNLKNGVYLVQVTQGSLSATNKIVRQ